MHSCPTLKATQSEIFPNSEYIWVTLSVLPHTLVGIQLLVIIIAKKTTVIQLRFFLTLLMTKLCLFILAELTRNQTFKSEIPPCAEWFQYLYLQSMLLIPNGKVKVSRNFIADKKKHEMWTMFKKGFLLALFFGYVHSRIHLQYIGDSGLEKRNFTAPKGKKLTTLGKSNNEFRDMPMVISAISITLGYWLSTVFIQICENHRELKNLVDQTDKEIEDIQIELIKGPKKSIQKSK